MEKPAITQVPLADIIQRRWSGRAYDASKPVSRAQITALLEAARWAPSCFGDQPWRYIVWDKNQNAAAWQQAFDCLVPGNQAWVKNAPVLLLAVADTQFSHNQKANRWGRYDTGAASENICLQAVELGLMAHQMGGFDTDKLRQLTGVPEQFDLMAMMSIGYAADMATLSSEEREREEQTRSRKPLSELFFAQHWQTPYQQ